MATLNRPGRRRPLLLVLQPGLRARHDPGAIEEKGQRPVPELLGRASQLLDLGEKVGDISQPCSAEIRCGAVVAHCGAWVVEFVRVILLSSTLVDRQPGS